MGQINIRINDDEKLIIQALADRKGVSITEIAQDLLLKEIKDVRIDLAFHLLQEGKIGRKRALILSGLNAREFLIEWTKRGAEELIPDEIMEETTTNALEIDLSKYMKE